MSAGGLPRAMGLRDVVLFNIAAGKQEWLAGSTQSDGLDGVLVRAAVHTPRCGAGREYGKPVGIRTETMGRGTWFHGCWILVCQQI